jgi:formate-dependent nitrite reductase membrane component NrfD
MADEMKHHEDIWGWMLAADFFLAGMGGAILAIAAVVDLFVGSGQVSFYARLVAPVLIAMGAGLLIFELGRPLQGLRVFINPKSVLTFGAWSMTFAIVAGLANASFYVPADIFKVPWAGNNGWQTVLSVILLVFGLIVASYPGVLLARHKARPFWTGPGIAVLFILSSLVTAISAHQLLNLIGPPQQGTTAASLRWIASVLLAMQVLLWLIYLYVKRTGGTKPEANATLRWITGSMASGFWLGLLLCGTLVPLALQLFVPNAIAIAAGLAILGGAILRYLVVASGQDRTWIAGEQRYNSRLPHGDEAFLKAWNKS